MLKKRITKLILLVGLICLLFGFAPGVSAQSFKQIEFYYMEIDSVSKDSLKQICEQRGHIEAEVCSVTLMYCTPKFVDLPDRTLKIVFDQNIKEYICPRCGQTIRKPVMEKPDTTIIWKAVGANSK